MLNYVVPLAVLVPLFLIMASLRITREYERGVVFLLGRFWKVKGPGLILVIPVIQQMVRIDLRTRVMDVPEQDVISRDNVSVRVNAVVYFRVLDSQKAVIQVEDYMMATSQLAQTTLRSVLGQHELDEMLAERDKLNADIQSIRKASCRRRRSSSKPPRSCPATARRSSCAISTRCRRSPRTRRRPSSSPSRSTCCSCSPGSATSEAARSIFDQVELPDRR
jgi:hypothetical protein